MNEPLRFQESNNDFSDTIYRVFIGDHALGTIAQTEPDKEGGPLGDWCLDSVDQELAIEAHELREIADFIDKLNARR